MTRLNDRERNRVNASGRRPQGSKHFVRFAAFVVPAQVSPDNALLFDHADADVYFGASVFWTRRFAAVGGEQAMIEFLQVRRDGGKRGIIEIVEEEA
jgi:hypothetical protein